MSLMARELGYAQHGHPGLQVLTSETTVLVIDERELRLARDAVCVVVFLLRQNQWHL